MKYEFDQQLQTQTHAIAQKLFPHIDMQRVKCFRSYESSSRNTVARCHTIGKLIQKTILNLATGFWYINFLPIC